MVSVDVGSAGGYLVSTFLFDISFWRIKSGGKRTVLIGFPDLYVRELEESCPCLISWELR